MTSAAAGHIIGMDTQPQIEERLAHATTLRNKAIRIHVEAHVLLELSRLVQEGAVVVAPDPDGETRFALTGEPQ